MQLLFLFCTMLIVISEAFSQRLTVAPRSASFKRKTSRFSHRLRNPVTRYMYSDYNLPLNLVPFDYEISQYKAPKFAPQIRHGIRPHICKRKCFKGKNNVKERLRRHFLRNNLKFSTESIFNSPQSFESYQFPRSGYRHFRNCMGLRKFRDSKRYNRKKRKHQCLRRVHAPFYRKNRSLGMRKLIKKHKRFSNFKRQCVSDFDIETESNDLKPNVTDISASEKEAKTQSDDSVGEQFENESQQDFSVYAKPNLTAEEISLPVSPNVEKLEQPDDPKQYLSSLENDNLAPGVAKGEEGGEVIHSEKYKNNLESNLTQDISKLKHMLLDVEKALLEYQQGTFAEPPDHPDAQKKKGKEKDEKTATTVASGSKSNETSTEPSKKTTKKTSKKVESTTSSTNDFEATVIKNLTERCSPDGTWSSTTMGMNLTFTMQPNLMIKVKIKPNEDSAINDKWSLQGLSLSKRGGPFIFAGLYPQKRAVVTFLGQCKISREDEFIFGIWTLFHYSRKYTDLWKSIETKLDVLARQDMLERKALKKEKKKKEEKKT